MRTCDVAPTPIPLTKLDADTLALVRFARDQKWSVRRIARKLHVGTATVDRHLKELARLEAEYAAYRADRSA